MWVKLSLAVLCLSVLGHTQLTPKLDMFGLINILYYKADNNRDGTISESELMDIWHGFDQNGDKDVTAAEFIPSWAAVTTMSLELSTAYFYIADLNDDGQITSSDLQLVYQRFDLDGDGTVTAQEFNLKWQQLWREAPFAVLYLRADTNKDDDLQASEYPRLFSSLGSKADGSVTKAEFMQGWMTSGFGSTSDAGVIFDQLDGNDDDTLTTTEVAHVISRYDVNHNHKVELLELLQIVALVPTPSPS
ncbi:uncharacterized protein [Littorina saxatilis]|uniref:EF-hand domain-containing protein n=1 Tax=Littorina saxatilis TaxID=31220 RepID=A0AAN9AXU3_9CAEN